MSTKKFIEYTIADRDPQYLGYAIVDGERHWLHSIKNQDLQHLGYATLG